MEKIVFFVEDGITVTQANYISNMAKESYMNIQKELDNIQFYTTEISLMGSSDKKVLREGTTDISKVSHKLLEIAKYKSLIAWFREAIKTKEFIVNTVKRLSREEICMQLQIELPEMPVREKYPTEEELIMKYDIKQRNRYYWLDTLCSTLGKFIHPSGTLAVARENLANVIHNPHVLHGEGRDAILYSKTPTKTTEEVDELFFDLQGKYRSYQSELNSMRYTIEQELNTEVHRIDTEYSFSMNNFNAKMREIDATVDKYRNELVIQKLKLRIAIPDALKETYNSLNEATRK